jgi:hypothetical protein
MGGLKRDGWLAKGTVVLKKDRGWVDEEGWVACERDGCLEEVLGMGGLKRNG